MYGLYLENHELDVFEKLKKGEKVKPTVKYEFFSQYFNKKFNLSFGHPKTDTCQICDHLQNVKNAELDIELKSNFIDEKRLHVEKASTFYTDLKNLSKESRLNNSIKVLSFDYQ